MKIPFKFIMEKRQATIDDVDSILILDHEVWKDFPASKEMIKSRIEVFPEGNIVAVINGEIISYLSVELIHYDISNPAVISWDEITNSGTIKGIHTYDGEIIFGIADTVSPRFRNFGIGASMVLSGWRIGVNFNVIGCVLGSRIPLYHKYSSKYSVEEYIQLKREDGKYLDPGLRLYQADGFKPIKVVPNYINDPESENHGVLVYQANPFYNRGFKPLRDLLALIIDRWGHKILGV